MVATGPKAPATFSNEDPKKPVNLNLGGGPGKSNRSHHRWRGDPGRTDIGRL
jgi:hypothetical protein